MKELTGQEVHAALRQSLELTSPEIRQVYQHISIQWEAMSEEHKHLFEEIASTLSWKILFAQPHVQTGIRDLAQQAQLEREG